MFVPPMGGPQSGPRSSHSGPPFIIHVVQFPLRPLFHNCLVIVGLLLKMWMSIQNGFITVLLCRRMMPPAKEGGQGECTVICDHFHKACCIGLLFLNI